MNRLACIVAILILPALMCIAVFPQTQTIEISQVQHLRRAEGMLRDTSGSAIPGAQIELRQRRAQRVIAQTRSHLDGHFVLPRIAPGEYDIYIRANGFNPMLYHLNIDPKGSREMLLIEMQVAA